MKRRLWRAVARFAVRQADRAPGYDWIEDDSLGREDIEARMSLLPKVEVDGRPRVIITSTWPVTTQPQTWTGTGYTSPPTS